MTNARYSEEPYAGKPHVGICEGVARQRAVLVRCKAASSSGVGDPGRW